MSYILPQLSVKSIGGFYHQYLKQIFTIRKKVDYMTFKTKHIYHCVQIILRDLYLFHVKAKEANSDVDEPPPNLTEEAAPQEINAILRTKTQ